MWLALLAPLAQAGDGFHLDVRPYGGIARGADATFTLTVGPPGADFGIAVSSGGFGPGPCPPELGGECLSILPGPEGVQLLFSGTLDTDGSWSQTVTVPEGLPPGTLAFEAVVIDPFDTTYGSFVEVFAACPDDDAFEPNEVHDSARAVGPDGMIHQARVCLGNPDMVVVEVPVGARIDAFWTVDPTDGTLATRMWTPGGIFGRPTDALGLHHQFWTNDTGAWGVAHLESALSEDPGPAHARYDLRWTVTSSLQSPCEEDRFENNDTLAMAPLIGPAAYPDLTACGAGDWSDDDAYAVALAAGDTLDVTATYDPADAELRLVLLDGSGAVLHPGTPAPGSQRVIWNAAADTTVYLGVRVDVETGGPTAFGAPYALDVAVLP